MWPYTGPLWSGSFPSPPSGREEEIEPGQNGLDYIYEPSEEVLLEKLLPMYVHVLIYRALVETSAGENGAPDGGHGQRYAELRGTDSDPDPQVQQGEASGDYSRADGHCGRHRGAGERIRKRGGRWAEAGCRFDHFKEMGMNIGRLVQVIGPVVDVAFERGKAPEHH